jgi:hypothetical protein
MRGRYLEVTFRKGRPIAAYLSFAWTKPARAIIRSHRRMLDRISAAVH